jgi:hypothetical protein
MPKPVSKVGTDKPDMTQGNKVEPTTKNKYTTVNPKKPHEGHGHKGTPQH